ncbi:hypothetical protein [Maricaulis sp.]|uniref:hypothetical protein n=1 Tax=Maricaulis sp. TaxID=1486257 RepID=UPI002618F2F3|nr:hypothetical protein [Maricaulis sp.]
MLDWAERYAVEQQLDPARARQFVQNFSEDLQFLEDINSRTAERLILEESDLLFVGAAREYSLSGSVTGFSFRYIEPLEGNLAMLNALSVQEINRAEGYVVILFEQSPRESAGSGVMETSRDYYTRRYGSLEHPEAIAGLALMETLQATRSGTITYDLRTGWPIRGEVTSILALGTNRTEHTIRFDQTEYRLPGSTR